MDGRGSMDAALEMVYRAQALQKAINEMGFGPKDSKKEDDDDDRS